MQSGNAATEIVWQPQAGPQKALIDCQLPEVFYGGARGGGKTDGVLGKYAIKGERYGGRFNAIFFRRELPAADDAIERSHEILGRIGWQYNAQKYAWRSPRGARLRFRPLERASDAEKYQGQNVTDACVEEAGQYPDSKPIDRLNGVLRSAHQVPTQLILTGNPGGPGQTWLRERYIRPAPEGMRILFRRIGNGRQHRYVFIPSKLSHNRFLLRDEEYVNRLHLVGSAALVRAWLDGDWDAIEGAFFDCFSVQRHVIAPFDIPKHWLRFGSFDWGYASPLSYGWWSVASEDFRLGDRIIPKGALVCYREWAGRTLDGSGPRLDSKQICEQVLGMEKGETLAYRVADPAIWNSDRRGPSIAEEMSQHGILQRRADNSRLAGWEQVRRRMLGNNGIPMLYAFATCASSIRTIPALQHDETKPEDVDTDGDDHDGDQWRYACMSRPWVAPAPAAEKPMTTRFPSFNELMKAQAREREDAD